jgi:hypothetical protein
MEKKREGGVVCKQCRKFRMRRIRKTSVVPSFDYQKLIKKALLMARKNPKNSAAREA